MAEKSKETLKTTIETDLADNTAGLISAADVRQNMIDIVDSMNSIVSSGNHDAYYPFIESVRSSGMFISMSGGVQFPDGTTQSTAVVEASIDHGSIAGLSDDDHSQYVLADGTRAMTGNLRLGSYFVNNDGGANEGIKFDTSGHAHVSGNMTVNGSGYFRDGIGFGDGSTISSNKGMAKCWVRFDASTGSPSINSSHNLTSITDVATGKFHINVTSGVLSNDNFVAVGHSNARATGSSREDFDRNTVGLVLRDIGTGSGVSFSVLNEQGNYIDSKVNDVVIFGEGP